MLAMADIEESSSSSSSSSNSNAPGLFKLFGKTITVEDKDKPPNSNNELDTSKEGIAGALPCPRCKSKDTKFCYFNNYNVNQPRHFCRSCHRYWTAGGTLRNVPKGAGRRKTRSSPRATSPVKLSVLHE